MRARMCLALLAAIAFSLLSASFARAADPLIAAAGDISCQAQPETDEWCQQQATSDLLVGRPLSAVLTLGDNQYENGTLPTSSSSTTPPGGASSTSRTRRRQPRVQDDGARATSSTSAPRAGRPTTGYYSYDVGAWHMIALNSNCADRSAAADRARRRSGG